MTSCSREPSSAETSNTRRVASVGSSTSKGISSENSPRHPLPQVAVVKDSKSTSCPFVADSKVQ